MRPLQSYIGKEFLGLRFSYESIVYVLKQETLISKVIASYRKELGHNFVSIFGHYMCALHMVSLKRILISRQYDDEIFGGLDLDHLLPLLQRVR